MFIMDAPYIPAQEKPLIVLAQAAIPTGTPQPDYILNACKEIESTGNPSSAFHAVDPAGMLAVYLQNYAKRKVDMALLSVTKIKLLQGSQHGKITSVIDNTGRPWFRYDAPVNYTGNDQAIFLAEFEGKTYKVIVKLVVTPTVGESPLEEGEEPVCPPPHLIKFNGKPVSGSSVYNLNLFSVSYQPNPPFERDAAKARRPSTLRYAL